MTFIRKQDQNIQTARHGPELSSADRRESVAAALRSAREKHGQDVRSVAQVLRIRQAYLEALESGSFDKLPGNAYALGFLRTYAEYLGLNANHIVDRFKEESQGPERHTELVFPEPVMEGRIPGGAVILISVVLLSAAYGGWFYMTNQGRSVADLIPAMPDQIQTLIDGESGGGTPVERTDETGLTAQETAQETAQRPDAEAASAGEPAAEASEGATAEAPEPVPESAPAPVAARPAQPAEAPQVAAVPRDDAASASVSDAYSGPPIEPGPAPELEALIREEAPPPSPVRAATAERTQSAAIDPRAPRASPAEAAVESPGENPGETRVESPVNPVETAVEREAQPREEPSTPPASPPVAPLAARQPLSEQTVVIPAPAAPQGFGQSGERTPRIYGESNEGARIVLRAAEDSWVQVRDSQDSLLLTRVLRPGDVYRVPDQAGLTLLTGNAGGIRIEVDGITIPPIGPVGAVRRQIALDPASLLGRQ